MGLKDSVKNLVGKAKDKYDDYLERKQLEAEKRAEIQRLNTPIRLLLLKQTTFVQVPQWLLLVLPQTAKLTLKI